MAQENENSNGNSVSKRNSKRAVWVIVIVLVVVAAVGAGIYSTVSPHMPTAATAVVTNTSIVEDIQTSTSTTTSLMTTTAAATVMTTTSATMMTSATNATMMTTPDATGSPYVMNCIGSNLNYCQVKVTPTCGNSGCQAPCAGGNCYYNGSPYFCSSYSCYYGQPYSYNPQYSPNLCQPASSSNSSNSTSSNGTVQCSGYLHQDQNGCVELAIPFLAPWLETQAYQYYTLSNLPASYPPIGSWVTVTGLVQQQGYSGGSYPYGSVCPGNTITVSSIT